MSRSTGRAGRSGVLWTGAAGHSPTRIVRNDLVSSAAGTRWSQGNTRFRLTPSIWPPYGLIVAIENGLPFEVPALLYRTPLGRALFHEEWARRRPVFVVLVHR